MENKQIVVFGLRALSTDRLTKVTLMSGCLLKRASSKSLTKKCSDAILHLPHYSRSKQYFRTDLDILPAPIIPTLAKWLLVTAGICCKLSRKPWYYWVHGMSVSVKDAQSPLHCCAKLHGPCLLLFGGLALTSAKKRFSGENPSPHEVSMVRAH